jgi:formylglycine-generating enzyme required for sulfatase activity
MMEASGKRNRMFVRKNTLKHYSWLILFSMFACVPCLQAQQQVPETAESRPVTEGSTGSGQSKDKRRINRLGETSTDEWEMDLGLPPATQAPLQGNDEYVLQNEEQNQELQNMLSALATSPDDSGLLRQLNILLLDVLEQANSMMNAGLFEQAKQTLTLIQSIDPGLRGLKTAKNRLELADEVKELQSAGNTALKTGRVLEPEKNNALFYFKQALSKDPDSELTQQGLAKVQSLLVERALESARELDFDMAGQWLMEASAVRRDQKLIEDAQIEVLTFKQEYTAELEQKVIEAMDGGNFNRADISIIDLIALGDQEARVKSLRERLKEARFYGGFEPGQVISDDLLQSGGKAPEIVIIAEGSFLMGTPERSSKTSDHEKPQHRVTIKHGFGLGVREVTVAQFGHFIASSGYRTSADRNGKSRVYDEAAGRLTESEGVNWKIDYRGRQADPKMPVLHVSQHDAQAYVQWLSTETGKKYRLPSEAEYEYVARAGGKGTYWWGEGSPNEAVENLTGERDKSPARREWSTYFKKYGDGHWGPAPVGSIDDEKLVHPMGIYDIAGNVSEWTEDCWHQNYMMAPVDGSAWVNPGCKRRVARGGHWASAPEQSRAAFRFPVGDDSYGPVVGIRIARDL